MGKKNDKERIIKAPTGNNKFSGKVTIEPEELAIIEVGFTKLLVLNKDSKSDPVIASVTIEQWMIDQIEQRTNAMGRTFLLMPYAKKFKPPGAA